MSLYQRLEKLAKIQQGSISIGLHLSALPRGPISESCMAVPAVKGTTVHLITWLTCSFLSLLLGNQPTDT